nr:uncharacterized protein CTRU02_04002 [Colletotrichum truncatum]KAF6796042.1 hypothetical protein CTRU02_04002 [Colletotrichum truncatum]
MIARVALNFEYIFFRSLIGKSFLTNRCYYRLSYGTEFPEK